MERLDCLPRRCRGRWKLTTILLTNGVRVTQSFADISSESREEASLVVVFSFIEAKGLFIQVSEQMKGFDVHVGSFQGALEQAPEVFQTVRMDVTLGVANSVVDNSA